MNITDLFHLFKWGNLQSLAEIPRTNDESSLTH